MQTAFKRKVSRPKTEWGPSKTHQEFERDCNISKIVKAAGKEATLMVPRVSEPVYGNFENGADFKEIQNKLIEAEQQFMALPSKIREKFNNDPAELIEFCKDENNVEEAKEMGLLPPDLPEPEIPTVRVIKDPEEPDKGE